MVFDYLSVSCQRRGGSSLSCLDRCGTKEKKKKKRDFVTLRLAVEVKPVDQRS